MITDMSENALRYGEVLRLAMSKQGDTQADAAKKLGKSAPTVGTYVRGEIEMPYLVREKAARAYNIAPEDLDLSWENEPSDQDIIAVCIGVLRMTAATAELKDTAARVLERVTLLKKS